MNTFKSLLIINKQLLYTCTSIYCKGKYNIKLGDMICISCIIYFVFWDDFIFVLKHNKIIK